MSVTRYAALIALFSATAVAQSFDNSGNASLNGTYQFRRVVYTAGDTSGNLSRTAAINGKIVFDGKGGYTIPAGAGEVDSAGGSSQTTNAVSGTYTLSSSGFGFMSSPVVASGTNDLLYFTSANGVLMGSTTENGYNDLFFAALSSTPGPAVSAGTWSMAVFTPGTQSSGAAGALAQISFDGVSNIAAFTATGYTGNGGPGAQNQNIPAGSYTVSNGSVSLNLPAAPPFFNGPSGLVLSPDGNFAFGGSQSGFDMIVATRSSGAPNFSGLYFQAGVERDFSRSSPSGGSANLVSYYGSLSAGGGAVVSHERLQSSAFPNPIGSTFADSYPTALGNSYTDTQNSVVFAYGGSGKYRIGSGVWPYIGLSAAVQAPAFSGPGVFLNPTGVVNAASSAPFTAGISAGELLTLYGTNLAASTVITPSVPLPTTLGNVTVSVNGTPAPIYYVSPTQMSVLVPFTVNSLTTKYATIQVNNNGTQSNAVSMLVYPTAPGAFTQSPGGLGRSAIIHADGTLVTPAKPAQPGEIVEAFVTGLGSVSPPTSDGAVGPVSPLALTKNAISVFVAGLPASTTCQYCLVALAPGEAALYQVNLTIPSNAPAGDVPFEVSGPDTFGAESQISIGSGK